VDRGVLKKRLSDLFEIPELFYSLHAHLCEGHPPETLKQHLDLTLEYALDLWDHHSLNSVLPVLIENFLDTGLGETMRTRIAEKITTLFFLAIYLHDIGKSNPVFQKKKMHNCAFSRTLPNNSFESRHSIPGVLLFLILIILRHPSVDNLEDSDHIVHFYAIQFALFFSTSILKHHSTNLGNPINQLSFIHGDFHNYREDLIQLLELNSLLMDESVEAKLLHILEKAEELTRELHEAEDIDSAAMTESRFSLFSLLKLHYSLLTAADYLATHHYMNGMNDRISDFGILSNSDKITIIESIRSTETYNEVFYRSIASASHKIGGISSGESLSLNELRSAMAGEVYKNIHNNANKRLFYLEAPTGGGKTNLSLIALAELLESDRNSEKDEIKKIYYVFPFTTLITQTHSVLQKNLGLSEDFIVELHGKADFHRKVSKGSISEESADGLYGREHLDYIHNLFIHHPVVLLSHIRFFDILKSGIKEKNYPLHTLSNSIVIIDELQAYNPEMWDRIALLIRYYSEIFNMRFILMSATLPAIHRLLPGAGQPEADSVNNGFTELIPGAKSRYFIQPAFQKRVHCDFSLEDSVLALVELADVLIEKSRTYSSNNILNPDSVFTIIEFIYKKSASEFYTVIHDSENGNFFDQIFVLSGTILESRRKEIVSFLKDHRNRGKKILLITTQVVEAGVDIDMDIGFKNRSLLDSDEQLAGRINRNAIKEGSILYLFSYDSPKTIYGKDPRYKLEYGKLSREDAKGMFIEKRFDEYYNQVIDRKNSININRAIVNINDFINSMGRCDFYEVDNSLKLIDSDTVSIFVPLALEKQSSETGEPLLSDAEKEYLQSCGLWDQNGSFLRGEEIWRHYVSIITGNNVDIFAKKIRLKQLAGLLSKFTFSTYLSSIKELESTGAGVMQYGFFYLEHYKEVYDYFSGLKLPAASSAIFL
jgi:CRISPR-associated endonuclease/helicase Cas3